MLQTGSQSTITAQFVTSGSLALSAHSKIIRANSLPLVLHRASNSTSTERLVGIMHHYETIFCHMRGFRSLSGQSSPLLYTNLKTFRPSFLPRLASAQQSHGIAKDSQSPGYHASKSRSYAGRLYAQIAYLRKATTAKHTCSAEPPLQASVCEISDLVPRQGLLFNPIT